MQLEILYVFMPARFVRITIKTRGSGRSKTNKLDFENAIEWTQGSCSLRVISYSTCLRPDNKFESLWWSRIVQGFKKTQRLQILDWN